MKERRRFQRLEKKMQVKYDFHDNIEGMLCTSYTRDISANGFMMRISEKLPLNEIINMKFYLGTDEFVSAGVMVVRVNEIVKNRIYETGLQIKEIKEEDLKLLINYLKDNS